jgi:hypothetical protein
VPENLSTKSICIYDLGSFTALAETLAEKFGMVYLYTPGAEQELPKRNHSKIGTGIKNVEKVEYWTDVFEDVDVWAFPDCGSGPVQLFLERLGKRVWGSRMGEMLELDREWSKARMKELGISVAPYKVIEGMSALRRHLKTHEKQWVKESRWRGDAESYHARDYDIILPRLNKRERELGPDAETHKFIVEEGIDPAVELALDGYSVDGEYSQNCMCGLEIKSTSYLGHMTKAADMVPSLVKINECLAPLLKKMHYRNNLAIEARITKDGTAWAIDPSTRCGSPPSELQLMMYTNLADIIWEGSGGVLVDPILKAEWGAELMIHSRWAEDEWQPIHVPPKYRENVKIKHLCYIDGIPHFVPGPVPTAGVGAVVAVGSTMEEAIENVKEAAKHVDGIDLDLDPEAISKAKCAIEKLEEFGIVL